MTDFGGSFRPGRAGLERVFGELEKDIMLELWSRPEPVPVRTVHQALEERRGSAYNTVMTVMNRLVKKGVVCRRKQDGIWHYEPVLDREEFEARITRSVLEGLLDMAPEATLAQFVDVLSLEDDLEDDEALARLEALIRQRQEGGDE